MSYAVYDDLIGRYPALAKMYATPTLCNSHLIHYAEAQVNGMLAPRFSVPFAAAHPTVVDLTLDVAYHRAMLPRMDPKAGSAIWENIKTRVNNLLSGREVLCTGSGTTIQPAGGGGDIWSSTMDHHPTFGMLDADDPHTMVSSERLYAEEMERE